jgi:hypothetical protein
MTDYEDLHAVVITTPVVHLLHDVAPGEDRPGFLDLVQDLLADPWRILQLRVGPRARGTADQSCRRMKPSPPDCQACR